MVKTHGFPVNFPQQNQSIDGLVLGKIDRNPPLVVGKVTMGKPSPINAFGHPMIG
jgi:hypothetical protein